MQRRPTGRTRTTSRCRRAYRSSARRTTAVAASTRTRSAYCAAAALLAGLVLASSAAAHDFWIELSTPRAAPGEPVAARLFVGDQGTGEPFPRDPAHLLRFWAAGAAGEAPLLGRRG